jgi:hypothetical protein
LAGVDTGRGAALAGVAMVPAAATALAPTVRMKSRRVVDWVTSRCPL